MVAQFYPPQQQMQQPQQAAPSAAPQVDTSWLGQLLGGIGKQQQPQGQNGYFPPAPMAQQPQQQQGGFLSRLSMPPNQFAINPQLGANVRLGG